MRKFALILFLCVTGTAFAQQEVIIRGQDDKGVPRAVSTDTDGRMVGQVSVIDDCEVVPGWTALSNDTTGVETDLDHVMGAKSLEFDKVDGGDNLTVGGIQKTITALNLDFLVENGGAFGYSLNVSDTTDIDHCFLRLGTDASNYNEWRVEGTGLSVGWNSLRFNTNAPATDGATGDGWAPSVVTFIALGCNFNLETDALADIRVDHVIVHVGLQVAADINASVSSSAGATKVDLTKVLGTPTDVDAGNSGLGTQRVVNATDDPNLSKLTTEDYDSGVGIILKQVVGIVFPGAGAVVKAPGDANGMDVDINAQTLVALKVSATAAANTLGNPLFFQISQDGTNPVDATHPLPVSKNMAANADGNRIWVKSDLDKVDGTATNVNGGNRDAGTQTVAIADDDNVSTKLTDLDLKVTVEDLDTAAPVDNKQAVVAMLPSATGATLPDVGAGNVGGGTPRMTLAADDPAVANLTDIEGLLTSDNDAKELADYYDSTSQLPPLYVDDATLTLDNEPMADVMAAIFELLEDVRLIASGDGMAYTEDGLKVEAVMYLDNGATLDMAKVGATGGIQSETVNWPNSYDSGNGTQHMTIKDRKPVQPGKQGPTAVDAAGGGVVGDVVFSSRAILTDNRWCVYIVNVGGGTGDALSDAILLTSPTGAAGEWENMSWTKCDTLTNSGFSCSYCSDTARAYIQVEALCGAGDDTTVSAWYRARK